LKRLLQTPRGEVLIRPSEPGDAQAYRALRLEALKQHPTAFGSDYEESLLRPEEHWHNRLKSDPEKEILFFAEMQGKLVGMTGIYRGSGRKQAHSATVWGVYVIPELRGLHIAEALIRACLDWGREHGVIIARLGWQQITKRPSAAMSAAASISMDLEKSRASMRGDISTST
jgi:GNAT superfamily N-acetyltransferase